MGPISTVRLEQVDSTQTLARRLALESRASLPLVVIAARQSAGVGRLGRRWESPPGGLWFTLVVERPAAVGVLPAGAGIACGEVIRSVLAALRPDSAGSPHASLHPPDNPMIKWPNDLLIRGRKVGGVLIEAIRRPGEDTLVLCGVGLNTNVSRTDLPTDMVHSVATLQEWLGRPVNNDHLLEALVARLLPPLDGRADITELILGAGAHLHARETEVTITLADGRALCGVIRGLTREGSLLLDTSAGVQAVHSGQLNY
jgi:BirA family biotin operon repressor/biotin-[acetyl-CoA-carboxylase] ligase